jgi:signal transduction histidine kinase
VTLTGRLTTFFLIALGVMSIGFSTTLYLLARSHLNRQLDARINAALDTLVAAAELKRGAVEWEPKERRLTLGQGAGEEDVRWLVCNQEGYVLDSSVNLNSGGLRQDLLQKAVRTEISSVFPSSLEDDRGHSWRLLQCRVETETGGKPAVPRKRAALYPALFFAVAASEAPVEATLHTLAWTLGGLSGAMWLGVAALSRRLCRRALAPVTQMASAVRAMTAADLHERLPDPGSGDQLEDLSHSFNELLGRLQESFERQRRFSGDASHQLRTPLTALLGQIEVCLRRERPAEEYKRVLALVRGQADQLRHIVEMLLFLARADGEAMLPDRETINLLPWLDEYRQRWVQHARAADLHYAVEAGEELRVNVQPPLLGQLLDNLLENAFKFSRLGTPVVLRVTGTAGYAKLFVEDNGPGLAGDELAHVFEPFYRSPRARREGTAGVGLGLSIVQRIARAFGGSANVSSELGKGACFAVTLPLAKAAQPKGIVTTAAGPAQLSHPS